MNRLEWRLAWRFFTARRQTAFISLVSVFAIGGIAVGVAALIVVLAVMNGFEQEVRGRIVDTTAHLNVLSMSPEGMHDWPRIAKLVESVPGVTAVAPFVIAKVAIASKRQNDGIVIRGVDATLERKLVDMTGKMRAGQWGFGIGPDSLHGMVMGIGLASALEVQLGDKVMLYSIRPGPRGLSDAIIPKVTPMRVTGIFETGLNEFDGQLAYVDIATAQHLLGLDSTVTGLQVHTTNLFDAPRLKPIVEKAAGGFPYYVVTWSEMNKNLFSWMQLEKWGMFVILSLIIVVAAFNIISTLIMIVMEKTRDIGVLRALGMTRGGVMRIFMYEGLAAGLIGMAVGNVLGLGFCWVQGTYHLISLPGDVYLVSVLPVLARASDILAINAAALGLTFLASIYPARYAARVQVVNALRFE